MSSANSTIRQRGTYTKLKRDEFVDDYDVRSSEEAKFRDKSNNPPLKSILLATVLTIAGIIMLILGIMLLTGYIETEHWDRGYPLVVLGLVTFAPGSYVMTLTYCAFRGYPGYSYSMIPDYD